VSRTAGPALSARDQSRLADAFRLLGQGRGSDALRLATEIARGAPHAPQVQHMLALCRKSVGDIGGAIAAFDAALAGAPGDVSVLGNYANFRLQQGQLAQAAALLRRALQITPADARAWHALGSACRALGDLAEAEQAFRQALKLEPQAGAVWVNLGVVRRLQGDAAEALQCYAQARSAGFNGPEVHDAEASAWLDLGDAGRALALTRQLVATNPDYVPAQLLLAQLLWEHGSSLAPGEDAAATLRAAARAQPDNAALGEACLRFLMDAGMQQQALEQVRAMRARSDNLSLLVREAQLLDDLDESALAAELFAAARSRSGGQPGLLNACTRHLLRCGEAAQAAASAEQTLAVAPWDQQALAWLGIAWRLVGDAREDWLCGYEQLVTEVTIDPPDGFADLPAFLAALEASLAPLHQANRPPVDQSVRGGSQTSGPLFGRRDPAITAAGAAMKRAVERYVASLPEDGNHPFLGRRSITIRFAGSWSVRLAATGRHVNHFHQDGWISSAFYVALPASASGLRPGDHSGCIQFGQPPADLGMELAPRRIIRPVAGRLILFPSYIWHGTIPFESPGQRLTLAFDALPSSA
jgi:Flp pilus assembly protein TadD